MDEEDGGTYVLFLRPGSSGTIRVGSLGEMELGPGLYAYVGSGFGPGGVEARLGRHLAGGDAVHWHVDYLRRRSTPAEAWLTRDPIRREHEWAAALSEMPRASVPMDGFGASDCSCPSHLVHFPRPPSLERFRRRAARKAGEAPAPIRRLADVGGTAG